jgi:CheY-like chemotaxis protein/HPt (histidine-containing phosphotransfer) domain-containing protein
MQQSLLNLVVNAIKFTDKGSVTIEVLPATTQGCNVRFEVNDTGIGIPREEQTRIFEPFFSAASGTTSAREQGTGLGLDIVRRNTESMGGRVGVSSAPGTGSSFWIELPLTETTATEQPPEIQAANGNDKPDVSSIDAHVMLVDDNETNLMLGTMVFESLGLTVTAVSSGEEAVQRADPTVQDLIFMDISMPDMDGYEATRAIRQQHDEEALPIIALSAYASSVERSKARESGMNDYLTKPMQQDEGIAVLRKLLPEDRFDPTRSEEAASTEDGAVAVDTETLAVLRSQIGDANLQTVIGKFQDEARKRWSALASAEDHQDRAREAHTLASTCSSFGLPPAAEALREIEERAKQSTPEDAERLAEVGALLEQSLVELDAVLSRL